jgi:hypothetical protein
MPEGQCLLICSYISELARLSACTLKAASFSLPSFRASLIPSGSLCQVPGIVLVPRVAKEARQTALLHVELAFLVGETVKSRYEEKRKRNWSRK